MNTKTQTQTSPTLGSGKPVRNSCALILPIGEAREELRLRAAQQSEKLSRSVGRLTSCDAPCEEYTDEVLWERNVIDDLLYFQHCRVALERCLVGGGSVLRYKRQDGTVRSVLFRRMSLGRIKIQGLA